MIVTGWSNGSPSSSGAGYGLRLKRQDRDAFFKRAMRTVLIEIPGQHEPAEVGVDNDSFWRSCTELRSADIGRWMLKRGFAPWPKGHPPAFELVQKGERRFALMTVSETSRPG